MTHMKILDQRTVRKCIINRKAKPRFIKLIECLHESSCSHKMPFGKGFFCSQTSLEFCRPEVVDAYKLRKTV